jgi:hypothetical protein
MRKIFYRKREQIEDYLESRVSTDLIDILWYIYEPFIFVENKIEQVLFFIHRGRKGYSDWDLWCFDHYLARVISEGLDRFIEFHMSRPENTTDEEWPCILKAISDGFKSYLRIFDEDISPRDERYAELWEDYEISFDLFRQFYWNLWD